MARGESASAGTALGDEKERERRTLPLASMRPLMRVERPARKTLPPSMEALLSMARRGAMLEMREKERERRVQEDVVLLETGLNEIPVLRDVVVLKRSNPDQSRVPIRRRPRRRCSRSAAISSCPRH